MSQIPVIICSFYTPEAYYSNHAKRLRAEIKSLGLESEIKKVEKPAGVDWADATRMKIGFIRDVAKKHPESKIFWIDVDCSLRDFPQFIKDSSADLIGFQRSFGSPMRIGYQNRTRFWEPSFWGMGTSPQARNLIEDAYILERRSILKATDDYFLEEAWRANAKNLSFQMIPSTMVIKDQLSINQSRPPFFAFGSSGNVVNFKNKVKQHGSSKTKLRSRVLKFAKNIEASLPGNLRAPLRKLSDGSGVTGALTTGKSKGIDPLRTKILNDTFRSASEGKTAEFEKSLADFDNRYLPNSGEQARIAVARTLVGYASKNTQQKIQLAWWSKPYPGNFGDWLSPMIFSHFTDAGIIYLSPTKPAVEKHLFGLGSIGRFIGSRAVVVGTGVSDADIRLSKSADYVSVRGPITAAAVKASGGPVITEFGDPGIVLSEIVPIKRGKTNGKIGLIRHFTHANLPLVLPENIQELSVLMGSPQDITEFLKRLNEYDAVITSAMHVMIACHSYGIPCGLVSFKGYEDKVHGTGIKYIDYARGAGVKELSPKAIDLDLTKLNTKTLIEDIKITDAKKQQVIGHIKTGINKLTA